MADPMVNFDLNSVPVMAGGLAAVTAAGLCCAWWVSRKHPHDTYVMWYLFSLSAVMTAIIVEWGRRHGAFEHPDAFGLPTDALGKKLFDLRSAFQDLDVEVEILEVGAALVLVPQVAAYLLAGIFGCARRIWLVEFVFRASLWSLL